MPTNTSKITKFHVLFIWFLDERKRHLGPDFMFDLSEIRLIKFDLSENKLYRNVL